MSVLLPKLTELVREFYNSMDDYTRNCTFAGHWWDHIVRVTSNASLVLRDYQSSFQSELVLAAALCHDIAEDYATQASTEASSRQCAELMRHVGYTTDEAEYASRLIRAVDRDVKRAETADEKILYISDKLDLLGIEGTIRLLVEQSRKISILSDLKSIVAQRQADWFNYMISLGIAQELVQIRYEDASNLLSSISQPSLPLEFSNMHI